MWLHSRDVCVGVESKDLRCVHQWEVVDGFAELFNGLALGDGVAFVERKGLCEHVLSKPHLQGGGKGALIRVFTSARTRLT